MKYVIEKTNEAVVSLELVGDSVEISIVNNITGDLQIIAALEEGILTLFRLQETPSNALGLRLDGEHIKVDKS